MCLANGDSSTETRVVSSGNPKRIIATQIRGFQGDY